MADWPADRPLELFGGGSISSAMAVLGLSGAGWSGGAWPSANLAIFVPILIPRPVTVYKMAVGAGTTASGNFDVGIYDSAGTRLVSSGATGKGASVEHIIDVTDTRLGPGLYYLAMAADGTNNYVRSSVSVQASRLMGIVQMASAYVLPATATFAAATVAEIPAIAAYLRPY